MRGRNSDNTLIKQVLGWAPETKVRDGLAMTCKWIQTQIDAHIAAGGTMESLTVSKVVTQQMAEDGCDMGKK